VVGVRFPGFGRRSPAASFLDQVPGRGTRPLAALLRWGGAVPPVGRRCAVRTCDRTSRAATQQPGMRSPG